MFEGKLALVTGASSGIGREFVNLLAERKSNLLLVSRNPQQLKTICDEVSDKYGIEADFIATDLSILEGLEAVKNKVVSDGLEIDILINNAGAISYGYFHKLDWEDTMGKMNLNAIVPAGLVHFLLPGMIQRNAGWILNVASVSGLMPTPFISIYGASKAFIVSFTEALTEELNDTKVQCACLLPGVTATAFWSAPRLKDKVKFSARFHSPKYVALVGIRMLEKGQGFKIPGLRNNFTQFLKRLLPRKFVAVKIREHMHSKHIERSDYDE
jgi:short-subunit dehydrogenase